VNRDSLGDHSIIEPGGLHWTQAANGMMHEEIPTEPGVDCHGLQMFVNLAAVDKTATPRAFHLSAAEVPEFHPAPGVKIRVVVGSSTDVSSPLKGLLTPINMFDVHLDAGTTHTIQIPDLERAVLMVINGEINVGNTVLTTNTIATLDGPTGAVTMSAPRSHGANVLLLSGRPIGEPVVFGGPFAMTNDADIAAAQARFRNGQMGNLKKSF
jgi:redox-sensitive bicupin YhaK (pirin superfamily)